MDARRSRKPLKSSENAVALPDEDPLSRDIRRRRFLADCIVRKAKTPTGQAPFLNSSCCLPIQEKSQKSAALQEPSPSKASLAGSPKAIQAQEGTTWRDVSFTIVGTEKIVVKVGGKTGSIAETYPLRDTKLIDARTNRGNASLELLRELSEQGRIERDGNYWESWAQEQRISRLRKALRMLVNIPNSDPLPLCDSRKQEKPARKSPTIRKEQTDEDWGLYKFWDCTFTVKFPT